jgi:acyl dehydratase
VLRAAENNVLRVRAVNTAADSENKIHDDQVAAQYGFRGGLVPGVTVYGYLAEAALQHFGEPWLTRGAMDVRFHQPVYEGEQVEVEIAVEANGRARVSIGDRAIGVAWMHDESPSAAPPEAIIQERREPTVESFAAGTVLGSLQQQLDLATARMSAPLDPAIGDDRLAHPAILLALANRILVDNYNLGPWIHSASEVRKFSPARDGESIRVRARIEDRFERKGHEIAVVDVFIDDEDGRPIEHARHTAIWRPRVSR